MPLVFIPICIIVLLLVTFLLTRRSFSFSSAFNRIDLDEAGSIPTRGNEIIISAAQPTEYVFYNIPITYNGFSVVLNEIRIRNNGIFLIVRKNRSGHIVGNFEDVWWNQTKFDRLKRMKNPIREARLHVYGFSRTLRMSGIHEWIQGIVVFENQFVKLDVDSPIFPVLTEDDLTGYLDSFSPNRKMSDDSKKKILHWANDATLKRNIV